MNTNNSEWPNKHSERKENNTKKENSANKCSNKNHIIIISVTSKTDSISMLKLQTFAVRGLW